MRPAAISARSSQQSNSDSFTGVRLVKKILVGLKRVVDYNVRVRVKSDGSGVETAVV
jgi:hypothetical protein